MRKMAYTRVSLSGAPVNETPLNLIRYPVVLVNRRKWPDNEYSQLLQPVNEYGTRYSGKLVIRFSSWPDHEYVTDKFVRTRYPA